MKKKSGISPVKRTLVFVAPGARGAAGSRAAVRAPPRGRRRRASGRHSVRLRVPPPKKTPRERYSGGDTRVLPPKLRKTKRRGCLPFCCRPPPVPPPALTPREARQKASVEWMVRATPSASSLSWRSTAAISSLLGSAAPVLTASRKASTWWRSSRRHHSASAKRERHAAARSAFCTAARTEAFSSRFTTRCASPGGIASTTASKAAVAPSPPHARHPPPATLSSETSRRPNATATGNARRSSFTTAQLPSGPNA